MLIAVVVVRIETGHAFNCFYLRVTMDMDDKRTEETLADYYAHKLWTEEIEPVWGKNGQLGERDQNGQIISLTPPVYIALYRIYRDGAFFTMEDKKRFGKARTKLYYIVDKAIWNNVKNAGIIKKGILEMVSYRFAATREEEEEMYSKQREKIGSFNREVIAGHRKEEAEEIARFLKAFLEIYRDMMLYPLKEAIETNFLTQGSIQFCYRALDDTETLHKIAETKNSIDREVLLRNIGGKDALKRYGVVLGTDAVIFRSAL